MKAYLMYRDQDFDPEQELPVNEQSLTQDLELNTLFNAMVLGDQFIYDVVRKAFLSGSSDIDTIKYRQNILKDCLKNASIVRDIYQIPIESVKNKRKFWFGISSYSSPSMVLYSARELLQMLVGLLRKLKNIADEYADQFESEGFIRFFAMIKNELDDGYFSSVEDHLRRLRFHEGVLISAVLGKGNEGTGYILRKPHDKNRNLIKRIFSEKHPVYTFSIDPRDEHGGRAITELKDTGLNLVANALAQSADHIDSFINMLRIELAFYIGCVNLYEELAEMGKQVSFPMPVAPDERRHSFSELYDVCLALTVKNDVVGNEVNADHKDLLIITGANQGGKSTFLRSIGVAQLMMQCGMFVSAESYCANICEGLFTHFKRKEDASMKSGKLDEELSRMSTIADTIRPNSMVLFNESFAATNEREGSEIARQITSALVERRIKVFFVTHQYEFAHGFYDGQMDNAVFLRAERKADGSRTYKVIKGEPLQTSHGKDLYHKVFQQDPQ